MSLIAFLKDNEKLRGILNAGHKRAFAYILRSVGDNHDPRRFSTWASIIIAQIGQLPSTLEDRSFIVQMPRKKRDEKVERLRFEILRRQTLGLRRQLLGWAQDNELPLKTAEPETPTALHDRERDNWEPLIGIADLCGFGTEARKAALELSGHQTEDNENGVLLLRAIQEIFKETGEDVIPSTFLAEELCKREDEPWPEWNKGTGIKPPGIAELLKPFGIKPKQKKVTGENLRRYLLKHFEDAFSRYIPPANC